MLKKIVLFIFTTCLINPINSVSADTDAGHDCKSWIDFVDHVKEVSWNLDDKPTPAVATNIFEDFKKCFYEKNDFEELQSVEVILLHLGALAENSTPFVRKNMNIDDKLRSDLEAGFEMHAFVFDLALELKSKYGGQSFFHAMHIRTALDGAEVAKEVLFELAADLEMQEVPEKVWLNLPRIYESSIGYPTYDSDRSGMVKFLSIALWSAETKSLSANTLVQMYSNYLEEVWYVRREMGAEKHKAYTIQGLEGIERHLPNLTKDEQIELKTKFTITFEMALPELKTLY